MAFLVDSVQHHLRRHLVKRRGTMGHSFALQELLGQLLCLFLGYGAGEEHRCSKEANG